ncbi:hypothetical protein Trydic_g8813 [Trypoxylus dichotomus]
MYSLVVFFILGLASVQCAPSGIIGAPLIAGPAAIGIGGVPLGGAVIGAPLGGAVIGAAPLGLGLGVSKTIISGPALGLGLKGW